MEKTLAGRLAFLISNLGIKQLDFARRIQFAQSYVSMVLRGTKPSPGPRFINAVCREFSVNPEWLTNGKEPVYTLSGLPMSTGKAEILAKFKLLPKKKQQVVEDIIDAFLLKAMTGEE
ncbi:MAG: helix-turn-helix transcriptional regulator [Treponema sp.]|jgi:transcriptional regulator with XRE-family HTH domain|nr:helix-turn-helix transcriptional regulator [Treponema sp.]